MCYENTNYYCIVRSFGADGDPARKGNVPPPLSELYEEFGVERGFHAKTVL